ncbi:MAG: hypothetical protein ACRCVG_06935 [Methanobacteriaceae archaeon]
MDKKYIFGLFFVLMLLCMIAGSVNSVSAAKYKSFDKGESYLVYKNSWKSYYNGKTVVSNYKMHIKYPNKSKYELYVKSKVYLTKVSKTKLKVTVYNYRTKYNSYSKNVQYSKTNLSAKSFYLKYYKKSFKNPGA